MVAKMLIEDCTELHLYVGKAINSAYQNPGLPFDLGIRQNLVEQLKTVGVNATIQPVTWESWVQDTYSNRQFQSTVVGVDASNMTARAMLERFVSTASRNFINYNNADYDALFAQAQACYDDGEQTALYRAMEKNLAENAANVYIQDMADFVAVRDGLEGPSFYPIYVLDLSTIHYTK